MTNIKFYEFNQHEYYALIGANSVEEACEVYHENLSGLNAWDVMMEGIPNQITKDEAFKKFEYGSVKMGFDDYEKIVSDFGSGEGLLLVDGSLL